MSNTLRTCGCGFSSKVCPPAGAHVLADLGEAAQSGTADVFQPGQVDHYGAAVVESREQVQHGLVEFAECHRIKATAHVHDDTIGRGEFVVQAERHGGDPSRFG
jgi:hypothetical protein